MRTWQRLGLGMLVLAPCLLGPAVLGQGPPADVIYSRHAAFQIPFQAGADRNRLRQLQLFVSTDQGRSWQASAIASPSHQSFRFTADRDGLYWFTVQTLDLEGRYYPPSLEGARPSLKVFVDTHPPVVTLRALPPRGREIGVAWDIADDSFDPAVPGAVRLEYRLAGGLDWKLIPVYPHATQYSWDPGTDGQVQVRLRARDRAENWGEAQLTLDGSGRLVGGGSPETPDRRPSPLVAPPNAAVRMVNSKHFSLNYDVKEVGPSGVSYVDLWYTTDGTNWQKYRSQKVTDDPNVKPPYAFEVTVQDEGLYGFTLVVRSGVGLSDRPPQVGDRPQAWVEVDVTRPEVQINQIVVGRGTEKGKLFITWLARDRNLAANPITLAYAKEAGGPWTPIAEKVVNSGRYVWQLPSDVPYQFVVRVEAADKAGNVGSAATPEMIKVDLSQPKSQILSVEPVAK